MNISPAIVSAFSTISRGESSVFSGERLRGGVHAYAPPRTDRADTAFSGSRTSPLPVITSVVCASAAISMASSRRSMRSVRQSFASSTAARVRLPWCFSGNFEAVEVRKRVRRAARKTEQNLAAIKCSRAFFSAAFHHDIAASVASWPSPPRATLAATSHRNDGRAVKLFHVHSFESGVGAAGVSLARVPPRDRKFRWGREAPRAPWCCAQASCDTPAPDKRVLSILGRRRNYQTLARDLAIDGIGVAA